MNNRGNWGVGGLLMGGFRGREKIFICRNTNKTNEGFHLVSGDFVPNHGGVGIGLIKG